MSQALEAGPIDAVDFNGEASLLHASMTGHLDVVKLLVEAGHIVLAVDEFDGTLAG